MVTNLLSTKALKLRQSQKCNSRSDTHTSHFLEMKPFFASQPIHMSMLSHGKTDTEIKGGTFTFVRGRNVGGEERGPERETGQP